MSALYDDAIQRVRDYFAIKGEKRREDHVALERAQKAAAIAFGQARGWRLASKSEFGIEVLSRGGVTERRSEKVNPGYFPVFDHRWHWRCNRHAAGIASFPYKGVVGLIEEAHEVAKAKRLKLEILDEDGWYYPGATRFFLWTPDGEGVGLPR